jgi:hypothetical protein
MMTFPPAPDYLRIDASEHIQKFVDCVKKNGAVIIKNFATQEQIDRVNEETRPYIENDKPWLVSRLSSQPPRTMCSRIKLFHLNHVFIGLC